MSLNNPIPPTRLDLLFISHVHADHLNGIPQLLNAKNGLDVDTVVLPYFDMIERLIGYARDVTFDPGTQRDTFYQNFVVDPIAALSDYGPRQILFVLSSSNDNPGTPELDGTPEVQGPDISGLRPDDKENLWKLVGRGTVIGTRKETTQSSTSELVFANLPDSIGIAVPSPSTDSGFWLFSPFIDPAIKRQRGLFKAALLKALNHSKAPKDQIRKADFDDWLEDPVNRKDLILNSVGELSAAYEAVEKNINISSMCLYSGLLPGAAAPVSYTHLRAHET